MAEAEAPTNDRAVFALCEMIALAFILPPGEALYRGDPLSARMIGFFAFGSIWLVSGVSWPWLKTRIGRGFAASVTRVASDFRWWLAASFGVLIYLALLTPRFSASTGQTAPAPTYTNDVDQQQIAQSRTQLQYTQRQLTAAEQAFAGASARPTPIPLPRQITLTDALKFVDSFRLLSGKCNIAVTAAPDNQHIASALVQLINFPWILTGQSANYDWDNSYLTFDTRTTLYPEAENPKGPPRFAGFVILPYGPPAPVANLDADATPTPTPKASVLTGEIVVHASNPNDAADSITRMLKAMHLNAVRGSEYPFGPPEAHGLIYVQIGQGNVWLGN
jgi:hypothetical protein